ncbi:hypothetical protein TNCV_4408851 [Trichonephila clavipes]|nr:hypothetical protein TNCV_4408851 [Trichonephila clavipes]
MTVYCWQWYPISSHLLWERCVAVKQRKNSSVNHLSPHRNTNVITVEIDSGFVVAKDDLVPFRCSPVSRARHYSKRWRPCVGIKGSTRDPNVLQPGTFEWFEKTQGFLMNVLSVLERRPMMQLCVRVSFLQCSGVLGDWSVEVVLCLVFCKWHLLWSPNLLTTQLE